MQASPYNQRVVTGAKIKNPIDKYREYELTQDERIKILTGSEQISETESRASKLESMLSPDKRAKNALSQANEYERKIQNRVKFLAKEEKKVFKKIDY